MSSLFRTIETQLHFENVNLEEKLMLSSSIVQDRREGGGG